jgi:hypothetical protein
LVINCRLIITVISLAKSEDEIAELVALETVLAEGGLEG